MSDTSQNQADKRKLGGGVEPNDAINTPDQVAEQDVVSKIGQYISVVVDENTTDLQYQNELEISHQHQLLNCEDIKDIIRAIESRIRALELTPDGHPEVPLRLHELGEAYTNQFHRLGDMHALEKAFEHKYRALGMTPDGHPDLPDRHHALGISHTDRFRRLGDMNDLGKAIEHKTRALKFTPHNHPDLPDRHRELGLSYGDRFRRLGDMNDIEKAIEHNTRALDLAFDGHPGLPDWHNELGVSYGDRFQRLGDLKDLERAIEHGTRALDLTSDGDPYLPGRHHELGVCYTDRFQRLGDTNDLEKARDHYTRALDLTPNGHPHLPNRHYELGVSHTYRFRRLGDVDDIEKAIQHFARALGLTPDGHRDLPDWHSALGTAYTDRFGRLGDINDLEKAIEHKSHTVNLTPDDHPDLADYHHGLGASYQNRFRHLGDMNDLEKALEHKTRALNLTPHDHPDLPERHNGLGASYRDRFQRLSDMNALEQAIEHFTRAFDLTPGGHPQLPTRHNALGGSYTDRFRLLGDMNDIEKAIEHNTYALDLTPNGHPYLPRRHHALAVAYADRFQRLDDVNDLDKAIEHSSRAIDLTPDGHPTLPTLHYRLALCHTTKYERTNEPSHLHYALTSFRQASQLSTGAPRDKFQHALAWAQNASKHPQLNCLEAYQTAVDLLPQFIWLGATTTQRYQDLSTTGNLAVNATSAAIRHANPSLALEWLEHTRCVVWNQTTMLRSPLDDLHSSHPDLANRLQAVSKQLHDASPEDMAHQIPVSGSVDPEQIGKHRRRLAVEYSDILAKVRGLTGFEDFLQPMKSHDLVVAARKGPIVAINCHHEHCDALIIIPGQNDVKHLPLPNFTEKKARNARLEMDMSLRHKGLRQRGLKLWNQPAFEDRIPSVLLSLWTDIVKPVLAFLGLDNDVPIERIPHITWCPTGALSFLPLHAAGDYNQPRSRVFDYVISSYTPTLTALLVSTPNTLSHSPRILAIGQANTPNHTPLPGTTTELAHLKAHSQKQVEYSELIDNRATTAAVLDAMEEHDWVHLACHAHQNIVDATKSGFSLYDGTLDLASISRRSFKNKGLAFLSACQTATGDDRLPNEAIHLASGMLMAGYISVIATMWSVVDTDAPFISDKVYTELLKEGRDRNGGAGKALHHSVAELRDKVGEKNFGRWVPYIHIGS